MIARAHFRYGDGGYNQPALTFECDTYDELEESLQRFVKDGTLDTLIRQTAVLCHNGETVADVVGGVPVNLVSEVDDAEEGDDEKYVRLSEDMNKCESKKELRIWWKANEKDVQPGMEIHAEMLALSKKLSD